MDDAQALENRIKALDLVTQPEIAKRLEVQRNTVKKWRERHPDFPAPYVIMGGRPFWKFEDVSAWQEGRS